MTKQFRIDNLKRKKEVNENKIKLTEFAISKLDSVPINQKIFIKVYYGNRFNFAKTRLYNCTMTEFTSNIKKFNRTITKIAKQGGGFQMFDDSNGCDMVVV
jgi:hypothetical protein